MTYFNTVLLVARNTLCQETPCARKHPLPGNTLCQETPCVRKHPVPGNTLCQETPCAKKHPVPGNTLCQETPCAKKHPVPGNTLCLLPSSLLRILSKLDSAVLSLFTYRIIKDYLGTLPESKTFASIFLPSYDHSRVSTELTNQ